MLTWSNFRKKNAQSLASEVWFEAWRRLPDVFKRMEIHCRMWPYNLHGNLIVACFTPTCSPFLS